MKILVVSQYFWPESFIVNGLVTELALQGHQVEVLTGLPNYPQGQFFKSYGFFKGPWFESYGNASVQRVPLSPRRKGFLSLFVNYLSFVFFGVVFGFFRIKNKPDVIFCYAPSPITSCLPAIFLKWVYKAPLSFWVQDLWPESLQAVGAIRSKLILRAVGLLVRFIYSQCDQILVQSEAFRARVTKWNVGPEKIHYVPNWASAVSAVGSEPEWTQKLPQGFRIVFAGNVGKAQDMHTLIKAAEIIRLRHPEVSDIRWLIVGDGSERAFVQNEVNKLSLDDVVFTFGQKPNDDMPHLFKRADILLVILKDEDIFALTVPAKIQSYMAAGRPLLAAVNGEGARIVQIANAGLTCSASSAEELAQTVMTYYSLSNPEKEKMGQSGRDYFLKHFEQKKVVEQITALLELLL